MNFTLFSFDNFNVIDLEPLTQYTLLRKSHIHNTPLCAHVEFEHPLSPPSLNPLLFIYSIPFYLLDLSSTNNTFSAYIQLQLTACISRAFRSNRRLSLALSFSLALSLFFRRRSVALSRRGLRSCTVEFEATLQPHRYRAR